jgi:hypothetical protein
LFATAAQQLPINACALKVGGGCKSDETKNLLTPVTEQQFQSDDINAFEDAMESRLAGSTGALETEFGEPVTRIVMSPISNSGLTGAAAHHSDTAEQKDRQKVISFTFGLPEIGE